MLLSAVSKCIHFIKWNAGFHLMIRSLVRGSIALMQYSYIQGLPDGLKTFSLSEMSTIFVA